MPSQRALSGLRSNELKAAKRGNHLLLDDTPGEIQAQLKSDHQHSQLSLGHINRVEDNLGRKDARGEGWELRTDGHGVARAAKGLLITTEARPSASGAMKDMRETLQRLDVAQQCHDSLTDLAQQNGAQDSQPDAVLAIKRQTGEVAGVRGRAGGELGAPHLILASPAGIHSSTAGTTHLASLQHTALTSGKNLSIATGEGFFASVRNAFRVFVHKAGMKLIAAEANIDLQALSDSISLLAKLNITQTANRITITAKEEVVISGGGSYVRYNAGGIEHGTTGKHLYHGASHEFLGPKNVEMAIKMPSVVDVAKKGMAVFHLGSHPAALGKAGAGLPFKLSRNGAVVQEGHVDEQGNISVEHELDSESEYELELPNGQVFTIQSAESLERHEVSAGMGYHGYSLGGGDPTSDRKSLEDDRLLSDPSFDVHPVDNTSSM
ncbi:MAG TPA: type VI secretion system Vgr family protein [Telluria sp.]